VRDFTTEAQRSQRRRGNAEEDGGIRGKEVKRLIRKLKFEVKSVAFNDLSLRSGARGESQLECSKLLPEMCSLHFPLRFLVR